MPCLDQNRRADGPTWRQTFIMIVEVTGPLSLNSKEIKYKARNTRQRAPTPRHDTTCNQSHSRRYARGHQPPPEPPRAIATLVLDGVTARDILKTAVDLAIDRGAARTS